ADLLLELQQLLLDIEDLAAGGVPDVDLRCQRGDLERQRERVLQWIEHRPPLISEESVFSRFPGLRRRPRPGPVSRSCGRPPCGASLRSSRGARATGSPTCG